MVVRLWGEEKSGSQERKTTQEVLGRKEKDRKWRRVRGFQERLKASDGLLIVLRPTRVLLAFNSSNQSGDEERKFLSQKT